MIPIFSYIQPNHPFYPLIERLRKTIRSSRDSSLMVEYEKTMIRADLSQSFVPGTGWELKQCYWSFQYWEDHDPSKFHAITFYYSSKEEDIVHSCQFPSDPFLESVELFF